MKLHVVSSFAATEGADQRIPVLSAELCVSVTVGVIKSNSIHDEFNSLLQRTRG